MTEGDWLVVNQYFMFSLDLLLKVQNQLDIGLISPLFIYTSVQSQPQ